MNIQTQRFVTKSSLFEGLETLEDVFDESDHPSITWGGANRTMIAPQYFLQEWEAIERDVIVEEGLEKEMEVLRSRLWALEPDRVLIDLEN